MSINEKQMTCRHYNDKAIKQQGNAIIQKKNTIAQ